MRNIQDTNSLRTYLLYQTTHPLAVVVVVGGVVVTTVSPWSCAPDGTAAGWSKMEAGRVVDFSCCKWARSSCFCWSAGRRKAPSWLAKVAETSWPLPVVRRAEVAAALGTDAPLVDVWAWEERTWTCTPRAVEESCAVAAANWAACSELLVWSLMTAIYISTRSIELLRHNVSAINPYTHKRMLCEEKYAPHAKCELEAGFVL